MIRQRNSYMEEGEKVLYRASEEIPRDEPDAVKLRAPSRKVQE